jgi:LemA protein
LYPPGIRSGSAPDDAPDYLYILYILIIRQLAMDKTIMTSSLFARWTRLLATALVAGSLLSGCGYNEFQTKDEATKAAWGEVVNQYQRRADLIPNLVNTVKGYASHERETLEAVTRARAAATSFQITPEVLNNPEAFNKFQQVQGQLSGALSRLMAVSEKYPDLKANENFRDLQSQLEGTENRITVARQRYIAAVQDYNVTVRKFPNNLTAMVFGYETKPSFTVENEKAISTAPSVDFGK